MDKRIKAFLWMKALILELILGYYLVTYLELPEPVKIGVASIYGVSTCFQFAMAARIMYFGWAEKIKEF